jgi:2-oxoglutarate ferredoxin oxidoreductase subunit alpha
MEGSSGLPPRRRGRGDTGAQPARLAAALEGVRKIIVIEQNHTGQLFRHLRAEYDLPGKLTSLHRPGAMQFNPGDIRRHLIEWSRT